MSQAQSLINIERLLDDSTTNLDAPRRRAENTLVIGEAPGRYDGPATIEVSVATHHNKERKQYVTMLSRETVEKRQGYTTRSFDLFGSTAVIRREAVARHSTKALAAAHEAGLERLSQLADERVEKALELFAPVEA